jgi:hypothetical protein
MTNCRKRPPEALSLYADIETRRATAGFFVAQSTL